MIYTLNNTRYTYDHKRRALLKAFDETSHPRDVQGRFIAARNATEAHGLEVMKRKGDRLLSKLDRFSVDKLLSSNFDDAVYAILLDGVGAIASKMEKSKDKEVAEYAMDTDEWELPTLYAERDRLLKKINEYIERRVNEES